MTAAATIPTVQFAARLSKLERAVGDLVAERRSLARRVYVGLRQRGMRRAMARSLAVRAVAASDAGATSDAIAKELRLPVELLIDGAHVRAGGRS